MATSVTQAFKVLRSNLEITDLQHTTISSRQTHIRDLIKNDLLVLESFLTGSYSRSTMIAPLSAADIDIFIVLDPKYYEENGQTALLDKLKNVLTKTYKTSSISRNGQAVTINFTDFIVDIVPSFNRRGGGYLIPSTYKGGTWISTDPKKHVELSSSSNSTHNGDLVPLVKMVKYWNRTINNHFRSFHLEVLVWKILDKVTISNFPSGMRYFFDKGCDLISKKNPDPAGFSEDVGFYIDTNEKIADATSRFSTAYNRAIKAEGCEKAGNVNEAIVEWRKIFGDSFPVYG